MNIKRPANDREGSREFLKNMAGSEAWLEPGNAVIRLARCKEMSGDWVHLLMLLLSTYSYSEPDVEPLETNTGSDSASYIRSVLMLFLTLSLQVDASNWVLESSKTSATIIIEVGFAQAATILRELFSWRSGGGYPFTLHNRSIGIH